MPCCAKAVDDKQVSVQATSSQPLTATSILLLRKAQEYAIQRDLCVRARVTGFDKGTSRQIARDKLTQNRSFPESHPISFPGIFRLWQCAGSVDRALAVACCSDDLGCIFEPEHLHVRFSF
eukprot:441110-Rhodomonas_salina.2